MVSFIGIFLITILVVSALEQSTKEESLGSKGSAIETTEELQTATNVELATTVHDVSIGNPQDLTSSSLQEEEEIIRPLADVLTTIDYDNNYRTRYLESHGHFKDLFFTSIDNLNEDTFSMRVGIDASNVLGFEINDKRYVVHLLDCYKEMEACAFRINGVPSGWIKQVNSKGFLSKKPFDFTGSGYELVIESIKFDYCDGRRFCDYFYDSYNLVEVSIHKKQRWWEW